MLQVDFLVANQAINVIAMPTLSVHQALEYESCPLLDSRAQDNIEGTLELRLEWRISKGGNSGIIFDIQEHPKYTATYVTGPEMQVLDNDGHVSEGSAENLFMIRNDIAYLCANRPVFEVQIG